MVRGRGAPLEGRPGGGRAEAAGDEQPRIPGRQWVPRWASFLPSPVSYSNPRASDFSMPFSTVALLRRILFVTLVLGTSGTLAELLLLEHFEDWKQYLPLILLAVALIAQLWYMAGRRRASVRAVQVTMWLCIVAGGAGVILHYRGNMEFEREMVPTIAGFALFREAMMGATPALAPGQLVQLGLLGLAWAFRHPALGGERLLPPNS
jgi:hypothetical protein